MSWRALLRVGVLAAGSLWASPEARAGERASDFTLRDIEGESFTLGELEGKVVILSFWATWCGPCKEEMPHLQKLYDAKKAQGLVVVSIATDDARSVSKVKPYVKAHGYTFRVLLDGESTVIGAYNPSKTLPCTVILDRELAVHQVTTGYDPGDEKELAATIDALLAP